MRPRPLPEVDELNAQQILIPLSNPKQTTKQKEGITNLSFFPFQE